MKAAGSRPPRKIRQNRKLAMMCLMRNSASFAACPRVQHAGGPISRVGHFHWGCLGQLPLPAGGNVQDKNQRLRNGPSGTSKTGCHLRVGECWHCLIILMWDVRCRLNCAVAEAAERGSVNLRFVTNHPTIRFLLELFTNWRTNKNSKTVALVYKYGQFGSLSDISKI